MPKKDIQASIYINAPVIHKGLKHCEACGRFKETLELWKNPLTQLVV